MSHSIGLEQTEETKPGMLQIQFFFVVGNVHTWTLTHGVPNIDITLASPVIALREGLPIGEHVAFCHVCALSKAIVVQPGSPIVHIT